MVNYTVIDVVDKTRANHSLKIRQPRTKIIYYSYSFFVILIIQWNAFTYEIGAKNTFNIFRRKLRIFDKLVLIFGILF